MEWVEIDWNEILLLFIGALIGILGRVATMEIQTISVKAGMFSIYTKFNCLKDMCEKVGEFFKILKAVYLC